MPRMLDEIKRSGVLGRYMTHQNVVGAFMTLSKAENKEQKHAQCFFRWPSKVPVFYEKNLEFLLTSTAVSKEYDVGHHP
jgi:hypothetical protein